MPEPKPAEERPPPTVSLIAQHDQATVDREPQPAGVTIDHERKTETMPAARAAAPTAAVPGYELLGVLGRGGMGIVYKARQTALKRLVALKMILSGAHADEGERTRFKREAEAVARIQHPNIVQIFEVGEHEGRPYCALELVEGGSLAKKLDGTPWPTRQAATLVQALATGVQAAHSQGVIHRDLKPANILIAAAADQSAIGNPPSTIPKITDFGLAKQLDDDTEQTRTGQIMGTPSYMAPEQALGQGKEVGPAADVYALGVMLYELLTGRAPFKGASVLETLEQVRQQEAVAPRLLNPAVPRDLETVCLKCLDKQPERRYATAQALADDLGRFARGEPVLARPVGQLERAWRWGLRNQVVAASLAAVLLSLLVGTTVSIIFGMQAQQSAADATDTAAKEAKARRNAERAEKLANDNFANEQAARNLLGQANHALKLAVNGEKAARVDMQDYLVTAQLGRAGLVLEREPSRARDFLHDTAAIPLTHRDFTWHLLDRQSDTSRFAVQAHDGRIEALCFSPDGQTLATASRAGQVQPAIKLWSMRAPTPRQQLLGHTAGITSLCYSPDGKLLASASVDRTIKLWHTGTGQVQATLTGHGGAVNAVAFSPDGQTLASGADDQTVILWDVATGQARTTLRGHTRPVRSVAFHPTDRLLASGGDDNGARVWSLDTSQARTFSTPAKITQVAFAPDGKELWATTEMLRRWTLATAAPIATPYCPAQCFVLSRDGRLVATASVFSAAIRVREAASCKELYTVKIGTAAGSAVALSPDGKLLAAGDNGGHVQAWQLGATMPPTELAAPMPWLRAAALARDGRTLLTVESTAATTLTVATWAATDGRQLTTMQHELQPGAQYSSIAIRSDLQAYILHVRDRQPEVRALATGKLLGKLPHDGAACHEVSYSPDGRWLTVAKRDTAVVHDAATLQEAFRLPMPGFDVRHSFFSPDGTTAVTTGITHETDFKTFTSAVVWDLQPVRQRTTLQIGTDPLLHVVFHPDGKTAVVSGFQPEIHLHDLVTGARQFTLTRQVEHAYPVAFLDNGATLLTRTQVGELKLWHVGTRQERATFTDAGVVLAVSARGDLFVTSRDGKVTLWRGAGPRAADDQQPLPVQEAGGDKLGQARVCLQKQQWDQAVALFALAVQEAPHMQAQVVREYLQAGARERLPDFYQRLVQRAPDDFKLRHESGIRAAEVSLWSKATEDYAHVVRLDPNSQDALFEHLCLRLLVDDVASFKQACPGVLERTDNKQMRSYLTARIFTLTPLVEEDRQRATRQAAMELANMPDRHAALTVLGALDVRAGRHEEAQKKLRQCLSTHPNWEGSVVPRLWLVLALHGQGKAAEARTELSQAVAVMDRWGRQMPLSAPRFGLIRLHLHDWLEAQVLRREVEKLLAQ